MRSSTEPTKFAAKLARPTNISAGSTPGDIFLQFLEFQIKCILKAKSN